VNNIAGSGGAQIYRAQITGMQIDWAQIYRAQIDWEKIDKG
jgi:hypothetical protein